MEGVLFDFNGTLIFDNDINFKAWSETCEKIRGTKMTWEEYKSVNGQPFSGFMNFILKRECTKEEAEKYGLVKESLYRKLLCESDLELVPGAIDLFEELKSKNIPFTIATSSHKENVDAFITKFNLGKWFDVNKIVYFDFTFKGKPAPDIYYIAAKKIGVDVKKCVIFEDAESGLQSAIAAGGTVIGLTSTYTREEISKINGVVNAIDDYKGVNVDMLRKLIK